MKHSVPFLLLALLFFLIKLNGLGLRLSDSNIYFYTAYQMLQGQTLYKDIFFTNFPLLPYISLLYFLISGGNLTFYYLTPTLEAIGVSYIIYLITFKRYKNVLISLLSSAVYLFSFIVLATSDHQSGVFLASLFGISGYLFFEKKQSFRGGILIGLSILTKAYFLPLLLASCITLVIKQRKQLLMFLVGFFSIGFLVLLPSLIFARNEIFNNIVEYSLTRSQGISKIHILRFFVFHDLLLVCVFIYTIIRIKKDVFMGVLSLSSLLFILLYKDIYYLYLNFMIPFLAVSFSDFYTSIQKRFLPQKLILPTILIVIFLISTSIYLSSFQSVQKLTNVDAIVAFLKDQPESTIYGVNDITPALAYLSEKKLLNGIVDTNENIFRKGFLNESLLTKDAIKQHSLLISHGAYYPQFNIEDPLMGGIFDKDQVTTSCNLIHSYPVTTEGIDNRLNIFRCSP